MLCAARSVLQVSYMELYNEELTDLLSMDNDKDKRLRLLEDRSGVVVQGLEEVVVKSAAGGAAWRSNKVALAETRQQG
jgi:hypothetical protein